MIVFLKRKIQKFIVAHFMSYFNLSNDETRVYLLAGCQKWLLFIFVNFCERISQKPAIHFIKFLLIWNSYLYFVIDISNPPFDSQRHNSHKPNKTHQSQMKIIIGVSKILFHKWFSFTQSIWVIQIVCIHSLTSLKMFCLYK